MATIRIKLFAHIREQVGESEFNIELDTPTTVANTGEAAQQASNDADSSATFFSTLAAVNQTMVEHGHPVNDSDELALFPPVTGG